MLEDEVEPTHVMEPSQESGDAGPSTRAEAAGPPLAGPPLAGPPLPTLPVIQDENMESSDDDDDVVPVLRQKNIAIKHEVE